MVCSRVFGGGICRKGFPSRILYANLKQRYWHTSIITVIQVDKKNYSKKSIFLSIQIQVLNAGVNYRRPVHWQQEGFWEAAWANWCKPWGVQIWTHQDNILDTLLMMRFKQLYGKSSANSALAFIWCRFESNMWICCIFSLNSPYASVVLQS